MTLKQFVINSLGSQPARRLSRLALLLATLAAGPAVAGVAFGESSNPAEAMSGRDALALEGSVRSESGEPLGGALVSIFGAKLGSAGVIAFTDEKGRFLIAGLEPGYYTIRAYLSGFLPSSYSRVELDGAGASGAPVSVQMVSFRERQTGTPSESPQEAQGTSGVEPTPSDGVEVDERAAEFEWLLRHAERNILHERAASLPGAAEEPASTERAAAYEPRGELGLFAFERGLQDLPSSPGELDAQLAYARLNIPTGPGREWIVSAQLLESALSSWAARTEFVSERSPRDQISAGVSYGSHVYGDVHESPPLVSASTDTATPSRRTNEWFGSVYGAQRFQLGAADVGAKLAYHHFSYLDRSDYAAPRVDMAFALDDVSHTLVRGLFDYRVLAPGGEDLGLLARMVSADFMGSAARARRGLSAQTTVRYQVSFERLLGDAGAVELRVFQEDIRNPLLKAYLEEQAEATGPGHYIVMNQADVQARGVGMALSRDFGGVAGSVGYRFGVARGFTEDVGAYDGGEQRSIHDLTTSVRTDIDQTHTRVLAVYRLSRHPSVAPRVPGSLGVPGPSSVDPDGTELDARFNVQVHQLLPFIGWNSTQWELVLAVRNLFYEDLEAASLIDEMSVVDSPARVMGGVKVQF